MEGRAALFAACLGTAAGLLPSPAVAQRALTLDDALDVARAHNRDLQAARARLEQSATNIALAWAALLPQVAAQGRYTHNYKEVSLDLGPLSAGLPTPIVLQKDEQLNVAFTTTVPLVVPYAYSALDASHEAHAANAAGLEASEVDILLAVAQAYYAAAGADELLAARRNAVAVARQTLDDASARLRTGTATKVEVMRAELAVVRAEEAADEIEGAQARAYRSLATLLGTHEPLRAAAARTAEENEPPLDGALVESALRLRPELVYYHRSLEAADSMARSSAWRWAPALSAFGNAQVFNYRGFSGDRYSWAIGLQLDWALYDGGTRDAQRRAARAQQRELEARLFLLRDTVTDEVVNARRDLGIRRRALESAMRSSELSRETLRLVRAQYGAGKATQLDVLQAQDSLVAAEVAVAQARFAMALADIQLRRAAGVFPSKRSDR